MKNALLAHVLLDNQGEKMTFDPFADDTPVQPDPAENNWPGVDDEAQAVTAFPTREEAVNQINQQNDKLSVTFKYEGGFDQPWVVLKATSVAEMNELIAEAAKAGLFEAVAKTAAYTKSLGGSGTVAQTQSRPQQRPGQPVASTQGPNGAAPHCAHGEMRYAAGINKQGNPYSGYYCTLNTQDYKQKCPKVNA